jgi:hypothetical protein
VILAVSPGLTRVGFLIGTGVRVGCGCDWLLRLVLAELEGRGLLLGVALAGVLSGGGVGLVDTTGGELLPATLGVPVAVGVTAGAEILLPVWLMTRAVVTAASSTGTAT